MLVFVDHSTTPGGPTAYFNNPGVGDAPFRCVPAAIFAFLTLLGDGFMVSALKLYLYRNTASRLMLIVSNRRTGCS